MHKNMVNNLNNLDSAAYVNYGDVNSIGYQHTLW